MSTRTTAILIGALVVSSSSPGLAQPPAPNPPETGRITKRLLPTVDGFVLDQSPFDGFADSLEGNLGNTVNLSPRESDFRAVIEFDLSSIAGRRVSNATLELVPQGKAIVPGTTVIPIEVRGYFGDGLLRLKDFHRGVFVTAFDGFATALNVPVSIDVTARVRATLAAQRAFVGFTLRTNVAAALTFGSLESDPPPMLVVTLR